jgi:hypothetical protein
LNRGKMKAATYKASEATLREYGDRWSNHRS